MAGNANSGRRPRAEEALMVGKSSSPAAPDISINAEIELWSSEAYKKLNENARAAFRRAARPLMRLQLLTPLDIQGLARWAYWTDKVNHYSEVLDQKPDDKDNLELLTQAEKMVTKYGAGFGLSIYDRQKLRMKAAPQKPGAFTNNGVINMISGGRNPKTEPDEQ